MLELFDAQNLLEHVEQLLLGQNDLAVERLLHARRLFCVLVAGALQDAVELGHPGGEHGLLV